MWLSLRGQRAQRVEQKSNDCDQSRRALTYYRSLSLSFSFFTPSLSVHVCVCVSKRSPCSVEQIKWNEKNPLWLSSVTLFSSLSPLSFLFCFHFAHLLSPTSRPLIPCSFPIWLHHITQEAKKVAWRVKSHSLLWRCCSLSHPLWCVELVGTRVLDWCYQLKKMTRLQDLCYQCTSVILGCWRNICPRWTNLVWSFCRRWWWWHEAALWPQFPTRTSVEVFGCVNLYDLG